MAEETEQTEPKTNSIICLKSFDTEYDDELSELSFFSSSKQQTVSLKTNDQTSDSSYHDTSFKPDKNAKHYFTYYKQLLNLYRYFQRQQLNQLILAIEGVPVENESRINIESILPAFVLEASTKKGILFNNMTGMSLKKENSLYFSKLWKNGYHTLIEAFFNVYHDLEYLYDYQNSESFLRDDSTAYGFSLESKLVGIISGYCNHDDIFKVGNKTINISNSFLSDLLNQQNVYYSQNSKLNSNIDKWKTMVKSVKQSINKLKGYVNGLREELQYWHQVQKNQLKVMEQQRLTLPNKVLVDKRELLTARIKKLEQMIQEEEAVRKELHNKKQELLGNIRVYCRIRPHSDCCFKVLSDDKLIVPAKGTLPEKLIRLWNTNLKCFIFDKVFDLPATQKEVFDSVIELITSCVDGFNVCIMAYGQTGSGKTHTMMGTLEDPGVNRRAIAELLRICNERHHWTYDLNMSMVEIYNEDVRDLLSEIQKSGPSEKFTNCNNIKIMSNSTNGLILNGLSEHLVKNEEDIIYLLEVGGKNRSVGSTLLNIESSRSHLVLLLKVKGIENSTGAVTSTILTLCDLAGSESVLKSGAKGKRFTETTSINRSLTALARVFDSLRQGQKPSYRDSKLTFLLKSTLGGEAKCLLLINVRGEMENVEESMKALNFGHGAMQVIPEETRNKLAFLRKALC